ncbi:hypothetical protein D9757_012492 [Collybiopsis confluens]|uniref:Uncharacterized protein n=1 Tax=Collybiopsis confluens TaxID=2823264 RepID=A0A8H5GH66_9AGAR|nr:hypothetical protein D9757_012492 [Collybiopsis confluens]
MARIQSNLKQDLETRRYFNKELLFLRRAINDWVGRVKRRHTLNNDELQPFENLAKSLDEHQSSQQALDSDSEHDYSSSDSNSGKAPAPGPAPRDEDQTEEDAARSILLEPVSDTGETDRGSEDEREDSEINDEQSSRPTTPSIQFRELINPGAPIPHPLPLVDARSKLVQRITLAAVDGGNSIPTDAIYSSEIGTPGFSITYSRHATDTDHLPPQVFVTFTPDPHAGDEGDQGPSASNTQIRAVRFDPDGQVWARNMNPTTVREVDGETLAGNAEAESIVLFSEESPRVTSGSDSDVTEPAPDTSSALTPVTNATGAVSSLDAPTTSSPTTSAQSTSISRSSAPSPVSPPRNLVTPDASNTNGCAPPSHTATPTRALVGLARLPAFYGGSPSFRARMNWRAEYGEHSSQTDLPFWDEENEVYLHTWSPFGHAARAPTFTAAAGPSTITTSPSGSSFPLSSQSPAQGRQTPLKRKRAVSDEAEAAEGPSKVARSSSPADEEKKTKAGQKRKRQGKGKRNDTMARKTNNTLTSPTSSSEPMGMTFNPSPSRRSARIASAREPPPITELSNLTETSPSQMKRKRGQAASGGEEQAGVKEDPKRKFRKRN